MCPVFKESIHKNKLVTDKYPIYFEYCSIINHTFENECRADRGHLLYGLHINCGGVGVFSLLEK